MKLVRAQMYRITLLIFLAIFNIGHSHADIPQNQTEFLHPDEAFQITYSIVDEEHITINWKIHPGYYLYMGMFEFESLDKNNKILKVEMPEGTKKTDEFFGEVDVYYLAADADIYLEKNIP